MLKVLMVFIVGFIEQLLYTAYLLSVNKKQVNASSILMITYMSIYLFIITYAIKDANTIPLLVAYALACGTGNWAIMKWENRKRKVLTIKDCNCTIGMFGKDKICKFHKQCIGDYCAPGLNTCDNPLHQEEENEENKKL